MPLHEPTADVGSRRADKPAILNRLRELVLSGEHGPDTPLTEVWLAEHFAISRTPIREALKQLQVEGLVEIRPKVGTFVRRISRREVVEMFELKEVLEGMAARLMAQRQPPAELEALERNVMESERLLQAEDRDTYPTLVHEFHETVLRGADSHKLDEHYRVLMNQLAYHRMVVKSVHQPGRLARSIGEHRLVMELISQKDGVGAELAMRRHVANSAHASLAGMVPELD